MDSGLTIRPTDGTAQIGYQRPTPTPVPQAVATDLAPSQSVTAIAGTVGSDARPVVPTPAPPLTKVDIEFDAATREVIFRIVDAQTGHLIEQIPPRTGSAYPRSHGSSGTRSSTHADFTV